MIRLNPKTISIPPGLGNRYVIPDIHGCLKTLVALIDQIGLRKSDQLFLLGDYINRGSDSVGVIDYLIDLKQNNYQIFPIMGNHEQELILSEQYHINNLIVKNINKQNIAGFYNSALGLKRKYLEFFQSLPYYIELDNFFLVHAGFDFDSEFPFEDYKAMLEIHNWLYHPFFAKNKIVVHGHNPINFKEISERIEIHEKIIPLDNGCVYSNNPEMGSLLCLELNSFKLIQQKNIEVVEF